MTIVEFLRARYDDDERTARAVRPLATVYVMGVERHEETFGHARHSVSEMDGYPQRKADPDAAAHFARHDPARVLREVEAKRRIVDACEREERHLEQSSGQYAAFVAPPDVLEMLALPYSDHPDYDPSWSPT